MNDSMSNMHLPKLPIETLNEFSCGVIGSLFQVDVQRWKITKVDRVVEGPQEPN
jgi:hypothetical protein